MLKDLVARCRSYRRFYEEEKIPAEALRELVDLARMTASTANSQALKFRICSTDEENERVFGTLKWAGALPDWDGPVKGERPSAYLILLCDLALGKNKLQDDGITAQTIMLGAVEMGYGGCMLGNVERKRLAELLDIDTCLLYTSCRIGCFSNKRCPARTYYSRPFSGLSQSYTVLNTGRCILPV